MKKNIIIENSLILELNNDELETINGGESLWYWASYAIGTVVHGISELTETSKNSDAAHYSWAGRIGGN